MRIAASAPGRICLFGEHQDYFGLPVVAAAVDVRCHIESSSREDRMVHVQLEDLGTALCFDLDDLPEPAPRAYWLSALKVACAEGWLPQEGWNASVKSTIPQQAGASSSTALVVAWCALIAARSGQPVNAEWVARAAHRSEVAYFNEPGGQMDHFACALGGVHRFAFEPHFEAFAMPVPSGSWLLLDSLQPKDTLTLLHRAKSERVRLLEAWSATWRLTSSAMPPPFPESFDAKQRALMEGTLELRDISEKGSHALRSLPTEPMSWGPMLTQHHRLLRDVLHVSTERIEAILNASNLAGAWGGKINGSGGGGTCFVVGHKDTIDRIRKAAENAGAHAMSIELGGRGVEVFHQD